MFGKAKKSATNNFIMAQGRAVGNLKTPKPFGTSSAGVSRGPAGKSGRASPDPVKPRTLKVGKNSRFSVE